MCELDKARQDLDEAFSIATRGGMRLHEADCHLAYARWYLAAANCRDVPAERLYDGDALAQAREDWAKAKQIIEQTGYHRRDGELQELEGR